MSLYGSTEGTVRKIDEGLHEKSQWKREKREKNRAGKEKDKREMLHREVAQHTEVEK